MENNKAHNLYELWDQHWRRHEGAEKFTWLGRRMYQAKKKALLKQLAPLEVETVLEVGCGSGSTLEFLNAAGLAPKGIDVSAQAVEICRHKGLDVRQQALEEVAAEFDLVFSDGMLEHFLNFAPYARHLMRISRRYVLLIQPNHDSFAGKTAVYLAELLRKKQNLHEYNYRICDFIQVFDENGFEFVSQAPVFGDVFRVLLFEKRKRC